MNHVKTLCFVLVAATTWADEPSDDGSVRLQLDSDQSLVFRLVSPGEYEIDYPDFYMLETEVTNAQFKAYLNATGKTKDDTVVLGIVRKREERRVFTTGDIPYSIEDAATIWRAGKYPDGLGDHPVALVTLHDATDFAEWVTRSSTEAGLIRLPTWNEWMIAAYGNSRNYPWGTEWESKRAHTSHGLEYDIAARLRDEPDPHPKRTEPVTARPAGRTPEGIFGLIGNVSEYILSGDPTNRAYFGLGSRSMGGGFTNGRALLGDGNKGLPPRTDYWGYSHHATPRKCDLGFRVVFDPTKNAELLKRPRIFKQNNRAWSVEGEGSVESTPKQQAEPPDAPSPNKVATP